MASEPEEADPGNTTGVPRLNIAIVLLWTAVCAALLAFHGPMIDRVPGNYRALTAVSQVVHSFFGGAGILAFLLLLRCRKRSVVFPTAIGHWFLFTYATTTILAIGGYLWSERLASVLSSGRWIQPYFALVSLTPAVILVYAMRSQPMHLFWKATVVAMILSCLAAAITMILFTLAGAIQFFTMLSLFARIGGCVVVALAITAAIRDVISEKDYDWLHWVGVASAVTWRIMQELSHWRV